MNSRTTPYFPKKVRTIVKMRDRKNANKKKTTFAEIAEEVGGTSMNCYLTYKRWQYWARNAQRVAKKK